MAYAALSFPHRGPFNQVLGEPMQLKQWVAPISYRAEQAARLNPVATVAAHRALYFHQQRLNCLNCGSTMR